MSTWRDRARKRLHELGLTQTWLAERMDVTPGAMQKWLAGSRQPSLDQIAQMAEHLKLPMAALTADVDAEDVVADLPPTEREVIRQLIAQARAHSKPTAWWQQLSLLIEMAASPTPAAAGEREPRWSVPRSKV